LTHDPSSIAIFYTIFLFEKIFYAIFCNPKRAITLLLSTTWSTFNKFTDVYQIFISILSSLSFSFSVFYPFIFIILFLLFIIPLDHGGTQANSK